MIEVRIGPTAAPYVRRGAAVVEELLRRTAASRSPGGLLAMGSDPVKFLVTLRDCQETTLVLDRGTFPLLYFAIRNGRSVDEVDAGWRDEVDTWLAAMRPTILLLRDPVGSLAVLADPPKISLG